MFYSSQQERSHELLGWFAQVSTGLCFTLPNKREAMSYWAGLPKSVLGWFWDMDGSSARIKWANLSEAIPWAIRW